ncbi:DLW-39 family protein [Nocardioides pyridinolyticus]
MKKILFLLSLVGAGFVVKRKLDDGKKEQALWAEATDPVERA